MEYSTDGGLTWHNGTHSTSFRSMLISDLTPDQRYEFRLCALGRRQIRSGYSNKLELYVS